MQTRWQGGGWFGGLFLLVVVVLFLVGIFRGLWRGVSELWLYAQVEGRVESFQAAYDDEQGEHHPASIEYIHKAGDLTIRGIYPRRGSRSMEFANVVEDQRLLAANHAEGDPITVYYDPGDPHTSTLSPAIDPMTVQGLLFMTVFGSFGAAITIATTSLKEKFEAWMQPLQCVAAVAFLLTFLSFIPASSLPWQMSVPILLVMWAVLLPAMSWSLLAVVRRWKRAERRAKGTKPAWLNGDWLGRLFASVFWWGIVGVFMIAMLVVSFRMKVLGSYLI